MKLLTKSINITPVDGIFRNIVERSMINNDEMVVYSREKWEGTPQSAPSGVSLVISRPAKVMSGGMPAYMGQPIRELCLDDRIKKDSDCPPGRAIECLTLEAFQAALELHTPNVK
jgi:hypothetical protein